MRRFDGVAPPVATPFRGEELAEDWLRENLQRLSTTGLSGILVLGSNGESVHLSNEEKLRVVEIAREAVPKDLWLMVGTGEASTRATLELSRESARRGADAVLVASPFYYKESMKPDVLRDHYVAVADGSPIPVLLYNVPQFTGLNMDPALVVRLAEHPNIVGIKDSSGNIAQLTEIRRLTAPGFHVFVGSALVFQAALTIGADGGILAAANVLPEAFVKLCRLAREGTIEEARALQWSLMAISRAVTVEYGIGGLKAAMDLAGYRGGDVRSPLKLPDPTAMARLRELLRPFQEHRGS
jgi:4-hydroxy-2-oxoglutarate aldolase